MQRWLCLIAMLTSACTALPTLFQHAPPKEAQSKTITLAPSSPGVLSSISPPPAPAAAPRIERPAGHIDSTSLLGSHSATPQVRDRRSLYARSSSPAGALVESGVVVCSVRVTGHGYDDGFFAGGADVYMTLRVAEGAARFTHQTSQRIYSFPVARLEEGDTIRVRVLDDDVFSDDLIGEGHATYRGEAIQISTAGAEVSCRIAQGETVDRARRRVFRRIDRELEHMEGAHPELSAYDFGYPTERAAAVHTAVGEALGWMQPFDEELSDHLDRATTMEEGWEDETRDAVDAALDELPAPGEPVTLARTGTVFADELACGADAMRFREQHGDALAPSAGCLVRVQIDARRGGALAWAGPGALEVWGIDRSGRMIPAALIGQRNGVEWIAPDRFAEPMSYGPGDQLTYVLAFPAGTRPALLRVGRDRRVTVIRVE